MPNAPFHDPLEWFDAWYSEASQKVSPDPNAMTLATADEAGRPSSRVVLLKGWDADGFVFYTNRSSRKGRDMAANPHAALSFYWRELGRQIRIEGRVELVDDDECDVYFASRPRGSQLGAWASLQSEPLDSFDTLIDRISKYEGEFGEAVPRPPHWGGYRVVPDRLEFWESGEFRIHKRWEFVRTADGWSISALYP